MADVTIAVVSESFEEVGPFPTYPNHRALFQGGTLIRAWANAYPMLFHDTDVRVALTQRNNHYFEWLAAILLFHNQGLVSLQKYEFQAVSKTKAATLERLLGGETCQWLYNRQRTRAVQCPDLLAYRPDFSAAFFCEVKGPTDSLRSAQKQFFLELAERTRLSVRILSFPKSMESRVRSTSR